MLMTCPEFGRGNCGSNLAENRVNLLLLNLGRYLPFDSCHTRKLRAVTETISMKQVMDKLIKAMKRVLSVAVEGRTQSPTAAVELVSNNSHLSPLKFSGQLR